MRSMYRFSVIALAVGAMALFGLATPSRADVSISGVAWAGIGVHKTTPKSGSGTTDIRADSLAEVNFTGGVGNVTAKFRYRAIGQQNPQGGSSKTPAAVRHQVDWKVNDGLDLVFMGQSFGIPDSFVGYSESTQGVFTSQGDIGDMLASPEAFYVNRGGLDIRAGSGGIEYGIAIIDSCAPACATTVKTPTGYDSTGAPITDKAGKTLTTSTNTNSQESTLVPHFMMTSGPLHVGLYYAAASGKGTDASGATVTPKANELNLGLGYDAGATKFGFKYVSGKDNPNTYKYTGMMLGGYVGAVGAHYVTNSEKDAAGTKTEDLNEVSATYTVPLTAKADFITGITQRQDKLASTKDMLLLFSAKTTF